MNKISRDDDYKCHCTRVCMYVWMLCSCNAWGWLLLSYMYTTRLSIVLPTNLYLMFICRYRAHVYLYIYIYLSLPVVKDFYYSRIRERLLLLWLHFHAIIGCHDYLYSFSLFRTFNSLWWNEIWIKNKKDLRQYLQLAIWTYIYSRLVVLHNRSGERTSISDTRGSSLRGILSRECTTSAK